jgi:hypothetical protein
VHNIVIDLGIHARGKVDPSGITINAVSTEPLLTIVLRSESSFTWFFAASLRSNEDRPWELNIWKRSELKPRSKSCMIVEDWVWRKIPPTI